MLRVKDEKEKRQLTRRLTGPLRTSDEWIERERKRDPDMPPVPAWWDDDDDNSGVRAAAQLGQVPR